MIIFVLIFVPGNFAVIYMINHLGLRLTIMIGALFVAAGCWTRLLTHATGEFGIVCIGSALTAFGQVCLISSISKVASVWFSDK